MKIDSTTTRLLDTIAANAKAGNSAPSNASQATSAASGTAVSRTGSISASGPGDFDAAKVERIRTAIEAGTYEVNPEAIADGMIADARRFTSSGVF